MMTVMAGNATGTADAGELDRLLFREQADSFLGREDVNAS
jgi:hypothetical protein